jgi:hypothetical protein
MLITSPEFTSNLTGKTYYTKSFDPLDCSTKNVIYGIECTLWFLYVSETRQALRSRMSSIKKAHHVDFAASRTWQISHFFDVIIAT